MQAAINLGKVWLLEHKRRPQVWVGLSTHTCYATVEAAIASGETTVIVAAPLPVKNKPTKPTKNK